MYQDKTIVCKDCGQEFVFTAGEQEFFAEKGFEHDPIRCKECRRRKSSPRERVQYEAVCSDCGARTTLPFVPKDDRPVYCEECLKNHKN